MVHGIGSGSHTRARLADVRVVVAVPRSRWPEDQRTREPARVVESGGEPGAISDGRCPRLPIPFVIDTVGRSQSMKPFMISQYQFDNPGCVGIRDRWSFDGDRGLSHSQSVLTLSF